VYGFKSRLDIVEGKISEQEDGSQENNHTKEWRDSRIENQKNRDIEDTVRSLT